MMGLRVSETANIRLSDISKDGKLTIYGKGHGNGKVVIKDIPTSLQACVRAYLRDIRPKLESEDVSEDYLLLTSTGTPVTKDYLKHRCQFLSRRSGIRFTYHVLRRFYCTTLANDCDLRNDPDTLRRMMRHADIATTYRCYLDADPIRMNEASRKLESVLTF